MLSELMNDEFVSQRLQHTDFVYEWSTFIVILPNKEVKHWILCQSLCDGEVL